jgi:asparagine synthase (glutamine-hydrolysing)
MFAYHPVAPEIDPQELRQVRDHMALRGPDGIGDWFSEDRRVGLGHRRLSIIDLSAQGSQPMPNEDGTVQVVFNGEIYNYRVLRDELLARGHQFRSTSDTEVLLHLYEERGDEMVHALRGMFAFALWDARKQAMLLARDPYGVKPLYYADDGWTVRAASQVKALLASSRVSRTEEPAGQCGFYLFGSVPEPYTLYQEIRAVPAGSVVWVDRRGTHEPKQYFSIARIFQQAKEPREPMPRERVQATIREALLDSVRHHLIADVPVGAFLSAGIDSGALVSLARESGYDDLRTVTLAFSEYRGTVDDESALADEVARRYGTHHTTRPLDEVEFQRELPTILATMDQPSIDGINTYFVSKAAAELGLKVALSGLGGDELFAGYPSFRDLPLWVRPTALPGRIPGLGKLLRHVLSDAMPRRASPKAAGMIEYGGTYAGAYLLRRGLFMPWEIETMLGREAAREGLRRLAPLQMIQAMLKPDPGTPYSRVATLEASLYMRNQLLRDADWASMAHSLEVRVPLVDAALLEALAPALSASPAKTSKRMLTRSLGVELPAAVTERGKTGFNVPIGPWLERSRMLDVWRRVPALARPGTHWARRWAYTSVALGMA